MSRLTLRLPQTLHQQLICLAEAEGISLNQYAEAEGISLNQYIVYTLTRQAASADFIRAIPKEGIDQQKHSFQTLLQQLGQASTTEIESALAGREMTEAEAELSPQMIAKLQQRIHNSTQS